MLFKEWPEFPGCLGEEWEAAYAPTAQEALDRLGQEAFAAVVADLRLPGTHGTQFLDAVMQQQPLAHRFILADLADRETMLKVVATAHQFISKPCNDKMLREALDRASRMEALFGSEAVRQTLARIKKMPSPPASYFQIVKELQSPAASMDSIGSIISQDPAITAKLLQMVNSATFGLQRRVSSSSEAVLFLGIETTKSLVLLAHTFSYFDKISLGGFSVEALWAHSLLTARLARSIATVENAALEVVEDTFTAGLLHDLGKLLLVANEPEHFKRVTDLMSAKQISQWEAEHEVLGLTHSELGAWLAAIWGLPLAIVEAISMHHYPARFLTQGFCPLTAVHIANFITHELVPGRDKATFATLDDRYLADLGLQDRLDVWRQLGHAMTEERA